MLQIQSLERGLDGRALPIEVRAGNLLFIDQATGRVPPFAPTRLEPVHRLHPAGRRRIGHQHHRFAPAEPEGAAVVSIGVERQLGDAQVMRVDVVHNHGSDFIIGRTVGTVFNPVVGGPDRVVNLESSAETDYDALLVEFERRFTGRFGFRAAYTLSQVATTTPTTIRSRSGADRSTPTICAASTGRRPTTSGTVSRCRAPSISGRGSSSPGCGRWRRACRWTS